ncbi:hypothetical protein B879_03350 [Cecembia lonarensis LW9]|uniref:Uncharacterized protein n=2 Tax=Cecembia TaxID=1187078 RepID=K1LCA6_CECL9|nr:hypothetical protein B879_03350 [Cecembia lonarensis LW9]PSL06405.1 hypothetical protein CLV48_102221 [Cecembia rubra]
MVLTTPSGAELPEWIYKFEKIKGLDSKNTLFGHPLFKRIKIASTKVVLIML